MSDDGVPAAFDPLREARVHAPGLELWTDRIDPSPSPPEGTAGPDLIRREHERLVGALESASVAVHRLADDVAAAGHLDDLVSEHARIPDDDVVGEVIEGLGPRERLGLALSRARLDRTEKGATTIHVDRPLSMAYCQRDTTIPGANGPVIAAMGDPRRQPEVGFVRAAWDARDTEATHRADPSNGPIYGGDYLPAGEFTLLGTGDPTGGEGADRTATDAARALLEADALGVPEVALVQAPIEAAADRYDGHPRSTPGPLTAWCNFVAVDLAVLDAHLAQQATVEVHVRTGDGYERERSTTLLSYLESRAFDWIDVGPTERWPTSVLVVDDGVVVPTFEPDNDGAYHPELNPTIEALKGHGLTVHPDGEGVPGGVLAAIGGGVHAMVCPIARG